jgi:hypothetical protein
VSEILMTVWKVAISMVVLASVVTLAAVTLGYPAPQEPGTPGVTVPIAVGGGGCDAFMCGSNHNETLV